MDRAVAIANEFLRKPGGRALTQMQLQKLVYIAHGWCLALTGEPLTIEHPEAWDYGPVYADLYDHTKLFGRAPIGREITAEDDDPAEFFSRSGVRAEPYVAKLTGEQRQIIEHVWSRYGDLSGARLSALTHQPNTPWSQTYTRGRSQQIPNELIRAHFSEIADRIRAAN